MQHRVAHWQLNSVGYERLPDPAPSDRRGTPAREIREAGEREAGHRDRKSGSQDATPRLPNLGLTKTQSSRWQRLASLPISGWGQHGTEARDRSDEGAAQPSSADGPCRPCVSLAAGSGHWLLLHLRRRRYAAMWPQTLLSVIVSDKIMGNGYRCN